MVRRARTVSIDAEGVAENEGVREAGEETSETAKVAASMFDWQGEGRLRVLRRNEKTQRFEPHGYFPKEATEEAILNEFGGGRYRAMLLVRGQDGREVIETQRDFDLPGVYKPPAGDLPGIGSRDPHAPRVGTTTASPSVALAPVIPNNNDLMEVLKAGIINTLLDMMKTSREVRPAGPDPMLLKLMEQQAQTQQKMMEFMLTLATQRNGGSREDTLELMAKMKELLGPGGTPSDPMGMFNTMLETFTHMREVAEDINPAPQRSGDPIMDSIPKLVEVVAEQHEMNKRQRAQAGQQIPRRMPPAPVPSSLPVQTEPPLAIWQQLLRQQAARLLSSAVAKHDPDLIAGTAILFAPPHVKEALALFLHREPDVVMADVLVEIPALADHRDWLADFITAAQERMFPDEFTDADEDEDVGEKSDGDTA